MKLQPRNGYNQINVPVLHLKVSLRSLALSLNPVCLSRSHSRTLSEVKYSNNNIIIFQIDVILIHILEFVMKKLGIILSWEFKSSLLKCIVWLGRCERVMISFCFCGSVTAGVCR